MFCGFCFAEREEPDSTLASNVLSQIRIDTISLEFGPQNGVRLHRHWIGSDRIGSDRQAGDLQEECAKRPHQAIES
jgi:hypothetical protein